LNGSIRAFTLASVSALSVIHGVLVMRPRFRNRMGRKEGGATDHPSAETVAIDLRPQAASLIFGSGLACTLGCPCSLASESTSASG
jgi:hypothetical protein